MSAVVPRVRPTGPAPAPHRPLRLLPAPPSDPPYDDEPGTRPRLRLVPAHDAGSTSRGKPPAPSPPVAPGPAVPARRRAALPSQDDAQARTAAGALPASRPFAHALVQRLLEVCSGARPVSQLRRDTTPDLYAQIEHALAGRPRPRAVGPARRDIRSVHVQERPDGVAEVCATVLRAGRAGALALRLEGRCGRWLCTELLGL